MSLLGGLISIGNASMLLLVIFTVLFLGYALGRIKIKGISLGDAGVFLIALLVGALFFGVNDSGALLINFATHYDFSGGLALIESIPDAEALWIMTDESRQQSSGFASYLTEP